jgi:predicted acylesterase/phospholipase RssA
MAQRTRPNRFRSIPAITTLLCLVTGCTHVNKQLNAANVPLEKRATNHTLAALNADVSPVVKPSDDGKKLGPSRDILPATSPTTLPVDLREDGCFVGVAISGGGSRSANFSAGCLLQLQRLGLLQRVDYISSVSGGSMTAALYCLSDEKQWNPGDVQKKLSHAFATDLFWQTIIPWNTIAMLATDWDRTDLLADEFQRELYHDTKGRGQTFADLRPDRPRLLINATDLQSGHKFIFCNEAFDSINSDLSQYPIARAVAASSAVPVLLHQVTLRDYSTVFKQYVHLIDGGIVDNLGVQSLVEVYTAHVEAAQKAGRPSPYPRGAVLLVIDARTEFDAQLSNKGDVGLFNSMIMGAGLTSTALLNRVSSATMSEIIVKYAADQTTAQQLRDHIRLLEETGDLTVKDRNGSPVRVVHLALSRLKDLGDLPFASFRERVNGIQTYFNIDPTEAFNLYKAADLLVSRHFEPKLRQILTDLDNPAAAPAGTGQAPPATAGQTPRKNAGTP